MGWLRRLDLFPAVAPDRQPKTALGSLVSLISLVCLALLIGAEFRDYRNQRLRSRAFVMNLEHHEIKFDLEVELFHVACDHISVGMLIPYSGFVLHKEARELGCRIHGNGFIRALDNEIIIAPTDLTAFLALFGIANPASMDLSHRINTFKLGMSTAAVERLASKSSKIRVNPLSGAEFKAPPAAGRHSSFYYDVNLLIARVGDAHNVLYTHRKNAVETAGTNVFLKFNLDFSPIAIDYNEGREDFAQFLTYVCGIFGGVLSLIKFGYGAVGRFARPPISVELPH